MNGPFSPKAVFSRGSGEMGQVLVGFCWVLGGSEDPDGDSAPEGCQERMWDFVPAEDYIQVGRVSMTCQHATLMYS